jgi:hypothetical protein
LKRLRFRGTESASIAVDLQRFLRSCDLPEAFLDRSGFRSV